MNKDHDSLLWIVYRIKLNFLKQKKSSIFPCILLDNSHNKWTYMQTFIWFFFQVLKTIPFSVLISEPRRKNKIKKTLRKTESHKYLEHTSTQITEVTWAPKFTIHAVDRPFPKAAARPSWFNQFNFSHLMIKKDFKNSTWYMRKIQTFRAEWDTEIYPPGEPLLSWSANLVKQ